MANLAHFPFYPRDWLADTRKLSAVEARAYIDLLCHMWLEPDCTLPNDDAQLARMASVPIYKWRKIRVRLLDGFLQVESQKKLSQKRLKIERSKSEKFAHDQRSRRLKTNKTARPSVNPGVTGEEPARATPYPYTEDSKNEGVRESECKRVRGESMRGGNSRAARSLPLPSPLPKNWTPSPNGIAFAECRGLTGLPLEAETEKFRSWHVGKLQADWDSAWRIWVHRWSEHEQRQPAKRKSSVEIFAQAAAEYALDCERQNPSQPLDNQSFAEPVARDGETGFRSVGSIANGQKLSLLPGTSTDPDGAESD